MESLGRCRRIGGIGRYTGWSICYAGEWKVGVDGRSDQVVCVGTAATFLYRQLGAHGKSVVIRMFDWSVESPVCVSSLAGRVRGSWSR